MTVRTQTGVTNPEAFNTTYQEVYIDLMTGFGQINKIDETLNKHQQLNQSVINNLNLSLKKASDELTRYERVAELLGSEDFVIEAFRDSNSFETAENALTERDGMILAPAYQVKLDIEREAVKLPTIINQNGMIGPAGVKLATIKVGKQLGGGLIRIQNPENGVEKAIDTSMETFWGETIMVDAPIRVPVIDQHWRIEHGALCELIVNFDYLTQINEITLAPFAEFPLEIVAIEYFETDNTDESPIPLINPAFKEGLNSRTITDATSYQMNDVYAKRLRVILNQIHYIKSDFLVNKQESEQLALWFAAKTETEPDSIELDDKLHSKPLYQDKAESNKGYVYFNKALRGVSPEIEELMNLGQPQESVSSIVKFAYSYGLYNLGVFRNEYQNKGIYVSKPMSVAGNIKAVSLEVDEEHPVLQNSDLRFTDIEYYVADATAPDAEWYPILPRNIDMIYAELLQPTFSGTQYQAPLRFIPAGPVKVRRNGIELYPQLGDYMVAAGVVTLRNYDVSATYTAEYMPTSDAYDVDFQEKTTANPMLEAYIGTNNLGEITLAHYPYIDRTELNAQAAGWDPSYLSSGYTPIKVKLIDGNGVHIDQPLSLGKVGLMNKTDYFDPESSSLEPFDIEAKNYQYIISGNTLLFNTVLPEDTRIIVEYPLLADTIRVKAILRRNIESFYGLTPVLSEYVVRYQKLV
ncbi:hypothetical protein D3C85_740540 [compost metagenome]